MQLLCSPIDSRNFRTKSKHNITTERMPQSVEPLKHPVRAKYQVGRPLVPRGFVKCFPRVPPAVGLYCSCHAAPSIKQGELSENILQNLRNTWLPHLVVRGSQRHEIVPSHCSSSSRRSAWSMTRTCPSSPCASCPPSAAPSSRPPSTSYSASSGSPSGRAPSQASCFSWVNFLEVGFIFRESESLI